MYKIFVFVLLGVLIGGFTSYLPGYSFAFFIVLLGLLVGVISIHKTIPNDRKFLVNLFLIGFLLRIFLSILLHLYASQFTYGESPYGSGSEGFFIEDGLTYFSNGQVLSELWQRKIFPDMETFRSHFAPCPAVSMYDYFNGFIIWVTRAKTPLVFFFLNSLFGSLSILLIFLITARLIGKKFARYAAVLYCFWPSIVLWSTQNLKEPLCSFLVYLVILAIITLFQRFSLRYILCAIFSSCILTMLRPTMGVSIGVLFLIFYLILILKKKNKMLFILGGIILSLVGFAILKQPFIFPELKGQLLNQGQFDVNFLVEALNTARLTRAFGGSAIMPGFNYTASLPKLLFFIPFGLGIVFFMPFPWQLGSILQLLAAPEMLIWYILFPFTVLGFIYCFRENWIQTAIIAAYILIMGLILGLVEGNVGTLFRHRSVIFGLCLIFTGIGIQLQRKKLASGTHST